MKTFEKLLTFIYGHNLFFIYLMCIAFKILPISLLQYTLVTDNS